MTARPRSPHQAALAAKSLHPAAVCFRCWALRDPSLGSPSPAASIEAHPSRRQSVCGGAHSGLRGRQLTMDRSRCQNRSLPG
eukprot:4682809-Prymnesium_polylepis.1